MPESVSYLWGFSMTTTELNKPTKTTSGHKSSRVEVIDALRGLCVCLMVAHHLLYNLVVFLGAPRWFFHNPVFNIIVPFFAGMFMFLAGVSSRFSSSNIKRGLKVLLIACGVTAVTYFVIDMPIWFGILHFLGFSMLFYGLTHKFWLLLPKSIAPLIFITLFLVSNYITTHVEIYSYVPWALGLGPPGGRFLHSYDFYPVLPWIFVFLLGTCAGDPIREKKLPSRFYSMKVPFFPRVGTRALLIYILHQPILYGLTMLILLLM